MTPEVTPQWWDVVVSRVVDGDTIRAFRTRIVGLVDGMNLYAADNAPVPVRLVWVDTPERSEDGWGAAIRDLTEWINANDPCVLVCYGRDRFGRILGDLRTRDGQSASQWLMTECGWPPYEEKR